MRDYRVTITSMELRPESISVSNYCRMLQNLPVGYSEFVAHPAYVDDELRRWAAYVEPRVAERNVLLSQEFRRALEDNPSTKLIGYRSIHMVRPLRRHEHDFNSLDSFASGFDASCHVGERSFPLKDEPDRWNRDPSELPRCSSEVRVKRAASAETVAAERLPFVSVVMPVRNEESFIRGSLAAVLSQDYPVERMEVIVADGMSTDGTRDILAELGRAHPQLRMIDNPGRIVSTGLNAAIEQARGEIIIRVDGHAEVATDFVRQDVALLAEHPEAWVVGGPIVHAGRNTFAKAVAIAMSHPLGVGPATRHRFAEYEGYAEEAPFPALRSWVFSRVGNFDDRLVRNQDDELNYRITRAGGKSYVSPRVRYVYYVRESPQKLFRQYLQYSFWRIPMIRKHKRPTTQRQMVPPLFFLAVLVLLVVGLLLRSPWIALALPAAYAATLLLVALSLLPRAGFKVGLLVPVAISTMHVAYAAGITYGIFSAVFRPHAWDQLGSMAALSR